jgi:hypothetical protein
MEQRDQIRTPAQSKKLWALLVKLHIAHQREALALAYSDGRTSSTKLLYREECEDLINYCLSQLPREPDKALERPKPSKRWRKFFSLCYKLGWEKPDGKLDYDRINAWCLQYGHCHKTIKQIQESELPKLITQLQKIYDHKDQQGADDDAPHAD